MKATLHNFVRPYPYLPYFWQVWQNSFKKANPFISAHEVGARDTVITISGRASVVSLPGDISETVIRFAFILLSGCRCAFCGFFDIWPNFLPSFLRRLLTLINGGGSLASALLLSEVKCCWCVWRLNKFVHMTSFCQHSLVIALVFISLFCSPIEVVGGVWKGYE